MATLNRQQIEQQMQEAFGLVPQWAKFIPDAAIEGFWVSMRDFQLGQTKIPNKYKELIGLAVSGATRCRYCQYFHEAAARLNGATDEEVAEAAMMGAQTMSGSTFLNSLAFDYDEFTAEFDKIVEHVRAQLAQSNQPVVRAASTGENRPEVRH